MDISSLTEQEKYIIGAFNDAQDDIWHFGRTYLGHLMPLASPPFHKEIVALASKERRVGIAAPRNHGKTTLIDLLWVLHLLLTGENEEILVISNTSNLAKDIVRKIKLELENNEKIQLVFGEFLSWGKEVSAKWTEDHLTIHHPRTGRIISSLRAKGWGGQVRGLRPTKVICDDLEDRELVVSEDQRVKLRDWFTTVLMGTIKPDQQLFVIGTVLHPLSLLAEIIHGKGVFQYWNIKKYRALEGNTSLWPERWSVEELEKQKEQIGSYQFMQEYQNEPIPAESVLVKPDMIHRFKEIPEFVKIVGACDPAISIKTSADYTALVWIGVDKDNHFWEVRSRRGRWLHEETIKYILDDAEQLGAKEFILEDIGFQQILRQLLMKEAQRRKINLPIRGISLGKLSTKKTKEPQDKYSRLFKVVPLFENHRVHLKNEDLIEELLLFPTGSHDDYVDALVYSLLVASGGEAMSVVRRSMPFPTRVDNPYKSLFVKPSYNWRTSV